MTKGSNKEDYAESILKGRIAETLFEELMRKSEHAIYRFGYEAILQNLTQLKENFDKSTTVGKKIRSIPDFVILVENGKPLFIEVKFRWDGKLYPKDEKTSSGLRSSGTHG